MCLASGHAACRTGPISAPEVGQCSLLGPDVTQNWNRLSNCSKKVGFYCVCQITQHPDWLSSFCEGFEELPDLDGNDDSDHHPDLPSELGVMLAEERMERFLAGL